MDVKDVFLYLTKTLNIKDVKFQETDTVITMIPIYEKEKFNDKEFSCPFFGIAKDSSLTVDKFLQWKRDEMEIETEHEKNLYT